jgi:hypothetical protein
MCSATDHLTSCEIRPVIRFLHSKNVSAKEIQRELCTVYVQNVVSERTVRQWCIILKDGRQMFTMKGQVVGRPSVVSDDLVQSERRRFAISELSCEFSLFSA